MLIYPGFKFKTFFIYRFHIFLAANMNVYGKSMVAYFCPQHTRWFMSTCNIITFRCDLILSTCTIIMFVNMQYVNFFFITWRPFICLSVNFSHFLHQKPLGQIQPNSAQNILEWRGCACSNEWSRPFQRGDNNEMRNKHLKIYLSKTVIVSSHG